MRRTGYRIKFRTHGKTYYGWVEGSKSLANAMKKEYGEYHPKIIVVNLTKKHKKKR